MKPQVIATIIALTTLTTGAASNPSQNKITKVQERTKNASNNPQIKSFLKKHAKNNHTTIQKSCMPEEEDQSCGQPPDDIFEYKFEWTYLDHILNETQNLDFTLERVETNGHRVCSVEVRGPWGTGHLGCGEVGTDRESEALQGVSLVEKDIIQKFIDILIPNETPGFPEKLEKCPKVQMPGMTATKDREDGYKAAAEAFMNTYGGALAGIHTLAPVDIKYPDGFSYTFLIAWISFNPPGVKLLDPKLNEKTDAASNKCV